MYKDRFPVNEGLCSRLRLNLLTTLKLQLVGLTAAKFKPLTLPMLMFPSDRLAQLYPPGTEFPFHRLLRLVGLRWRYPNPPPHETSQISDN
jgi:hypothetical protein